MESFKNLIQFASKDAILRLVAKERGKYVTKHPRNHKNADEVQEKDKMTDSVKEASMKQEKTLYESLLEISPPHRLWNGYGKSRLPKKVTRGVEGWTCSKRRAAVRVYNGICKNLKKSDEEWAKNLNEFVESIQKRLSGAEELNLETPDIIPVFKEAGNQSKDNRDFVFRPICVYSDLKTKIILALTYQYILKYFDCYFHKDMLFMRSVRRVGPNRYEVPKFLDAIDMVCEYRDKNAFNNIYVGECDIQKFYDIFNHDVIEECFEDLFDEAKRKRGIPDSELDPLRRVIKAYLKSYNYPELVMSKNSDEGYWEEERKKGEPGKCANPHCYFKWVKEDAFVDPETGCYTKEEFQKAKAEGKIGIPQGGALSGIIVNVVMRAVDMPIVEVVDRQRLFIRYCDDILLMHTDPDKCSEYLDTYYKQLIKYKLLPHPIKNVSDFKNNIKTQSAFWHCKSKNVYRWGNGDGNASAWIAFVGYEMNRNGAVRLRKDKIDKEFKRIAHQYYKVINTKPKAGQVFTDEDKERILASFDKVSEGFTDYVKATDSLYTRSQARRLDNYLYKKTKAAAAKLGIADAKAAARGRATYESRVRDRQ